MRESTTVTLSQSSWPTLIGRVSEAEAALATRRSMYLPARVAASAAVTPGVRRMAGIVPRAATEAASLSDPIWAVRSEPGSADTQ